VDAARVSLSRAVELAPEYVYAHNHLAVALARQGRIKEALQHFQKALDLDPGYAEVYNNLGVLMRQLGRNEDAAAFFKRARELRPDDFEFRQNLNRTTRNSVSVQKLQNK
jgi:Flp pilus assembly protein TadD